MLRNRRHTLGLLLRQVSAYVDIDQAILSKIERSERKPTKEMLNKLSEILKLDRDELLIQYMSEKNAYEIVEQDCADKVLKVAEMKVKYLKSHQ
ncbi:helix-turn-helix transcriptional regulator [Reichenbachiella sp. MALMAid0571]|uniref:helix-turn-helix domain-containing protein n=1 Tax=Reichenbachiella sp. MALMAid0571 TaxID=3143939 RepID=UPI0032E00AD7